MTERKRTGISPEHHEELNHPFTPFWSQRGISYEERIAQLRIEYVDDEVAQKQLDIAEGGNEYSAIHKLYLKALKDGDIQSQEQYELWFKENGYADLHSTGWDE